LHRTRTHRNRHSFPTRRSSDLENMEEIKKEEEKYKKIFKNRIRKLYQQGEVGYMVSLLESKSFGEFLARFESIRLIAKRDHSLRSEEHTSELQSRENLVCRLLL